MKKFQTSDGIEYQYDEFGIIHQVNPRSFKYDANYVSIYNTESYRQANNLLQAIRLSFITGAYGDLPISILDNGYGNGAFLIHCKLNGVKWPYGYDVTGLPVPGCEIIPVGSKRPNNFKVWTFFDTIEHIHDLSFLEEAPCDMIVLSVPWCIWPSNIEWFDKWRHRKPDEHVHHFNDYSLLKFMASKGWRMVAKGSPEDLVRKPIQGPANILTMAFRKV